MKIVINKCHGGFRLSEKAVMRYAELIGMKLYSNKNEKFGLTEYYKIPIDEFKKIEIENPSAYSFLDELIFYENFISRNDPFLIKVVEELGKEANGDCADLKIVEIPDDILWQIQEYEGIEKVVEKHRSWS